jgi:acyl carrier protein
MSVPEELLNEIKEMIVSSLALEDVSAAEIETDAPLFGEGLGLDSIDALELALAISKKYGIKLDGETAELREHFYSVRTLADYISSNQTPAPGVS